MSTISASSFGFVTIMVRACLPAFFLEITFLNLMVGFAAPSSP
jgi:hypothetical protein